MTIKHLLTLIGVAGICGLLFQLGSFVNWAITQPSDFIVGLAVVVGLIGAFIGYKLLVALVWWGFPTLRV